MGQTDLPQESDFSGGRCADDEICVGRSDGDRLMQSQAYCASTNHFVSIGHNPTNGNGVSSGVATADFNTALHNKSGGTLAVEAVVTGANKRVSLYATSVVIQAQTYDRVWRTVTDGKAYCLRCTSLSLAPFPRTAQRVKVDVVLPASSPTGLLWLASYSF